MGSPNSVISCNNLSCRDTLFVIAKFLLKQGPWYCLWLFLGDISRCNMYISVYYFTVI